MSFSVLTLSILDTQCSVFTTYRCLGPDQPPLANNVMPTQQFGTVPQTVLTGLLLQSTNNVGRCERALPTTTAVA